MMKTFPEFCTHLKCRDNGNVLGSREAALALTDSQIKAIHFHKRVYELVLCDEEYRCSSDLQSLFNCEYLTTDGKIKNKECQNIRLPNSDIIEPIVILAMKQKYIK